MSASSKVAIVTGAGSGIGKRSALALLREWNHSCRPPWSDKELARKVTEAAAKGTMPWGAKLEQGSADYFDPCLPPAPPPGGQLTPPTPVPLREDAKLPAFPVDVLPYWVERLARDVAESMQVPVDMPARESSAHWAPVRPLATRSSSRPR